MYDQLRLTFETKPSEPSCSATCKCCREQEVKLILKSIEREVRLHLERGDKFIGLGPLVPESAYS